MKVKDIYNLINDFAPVETALSYDNVGILVGDLEQSINKAIVCLDATPAAVSKAISSDAQLIITHHPIIFDPLKTVLSDSLVFKCVKNNISVISMHTNLDSAVGGVNDRLAEILELENVAIITDQEGFSFRKGELKEKMHADDLAEYIKAKLGGIVRYTDSGKYIKTLCVCGGSGGSELDLAMENADAFLTADVKHNVFIEAVAKNFTLFDGGHFNTENVLIKPLADMLNKNIRGIEFIPFNGQEIKIR